MPLALDKVWSIATYEMRRNLYKKRVLLAITAIFASQIFTTWFSGSIVLRELVLRPELAAVYELELMWPFFVTMPLVTIFQILLAIMVASSVMSEEYEEGTFEILFTKPMGRCEVAIGKIAGGLILISIVAVLTHLLALFSATFLFGHQAYLDYFAITILASIFATMTFYSLSFMLSELTRSTIISAVIAVALLVILPFSVQGLLAIFSPILGFEFIAPVIAHLPTWISFLPLHILVEHGIVGLGENILMDVSLMLLFGVPIRWIREVVDVALTISLISIYSAICFSAGFIHLEKSDLVR